MVACGLRVRNVTPMLSRGGALVGCESLNHGALNGLGLADLMLMDTSERVSATTNNWHSVVWHPQDEDENDFLSFEDVAPVDMFSNATLAFTAQAPPGSAQTYEFEGYVVFEAKGQSVHGLTPSLSDPAGYAAVQNATSSVAQRKPHTGTLIGVVERVIKAASDTLTAVAPVLEQAAPVVGAAIQGARMVQQGAQAARRLVQRPAPRQINRFANAATSQWAAFPVVLDGEITLYAVTRSDEPTSWRNTRDGHTILGYVGTCSMDTHCNLRVARVDPIAWAQGRVVELEGPKCTGQSLQYAIHMLISGLIDDGTPCVYTGQMRAGVPQKSVEYIRKRDFVASLGLTLLPIW